MQQQEYKMIMFHNLHSTYCVKNPTEPHLETLSIILAKESVGKVEKSIRSHPNVSDLSSLCAL